MLYDRHCRFAVVCLALLSPLYGCGTEGDAGGGEAPDSPEDEVSVAPSDSEEPGLEHGLALFQRKCAVCHGEKGLGDGTAAFLLSPKPRDFSGGRFLLGSNSQGLPSATDLRATLERGMPGSAMPPWDHLPEENLDSLVIAVRHLAIEGRAWRLMEDDPDTGEDEAREIANDLMATGDPVMVPPLTPVSPEVLTHGRELYMENCAACHDEDGRGLNALDMVDEQGNRVLARDFTQGVFKGGSTKEIIALRILRGLHGSPMPASPMATEDVSAIAHFVRTLVPEGAEDRVLLNQRTLTAQRSSGTLTAAIDAGAWDQAPSTFLPVTPLWWRTDRIEGVDVQALHDGSRVALRLRWADPTKNDTLLTQQSFGDGAALGLSNAEDPPTFTMGANDEPISLWHWKAAWQRDAAGGPPALTAAFTGLPKDSQLTYAGHPGQADFATGQVAGNPLSQASHTNVVEVANAVGFGSLTTQGDEAQQVEGSATWADGYWTVVFLRDFDTDAESDVAFAAGERVAVNFALWDGAAGDRNGQKCVSIWHELVLAR